jgi:hypothetical protein
LLLFPRDEGYGGGNGINIRFLQHLYPFSATRRQTDAAPAATR